MTSSAEADFRRGFWKIHILHHAEGRDIWGAWLLEELAEHGHHLSPGTLYPALARMERRGWIARTHATRHARERRTFRITASGRKLLRTLRRDIAELHEEVVLGREPHHGRRTPVSAPEASGRRKPAGASSGSAKTSRERASRGRR